jgi:hypothetical protein
MTRFFLSLAMMASALMASSANAATGRIRYVTNGDTFRLESSERIRIANIDAPEIHANQAKCSSEIVQEEAAAARARALLDHRRVTFVRVGQSYNRTVARVTFDGRDLGKRSWRWARRGLGCTTPQSRTGVRGGFSGCQPRRAICSLTQSSAVS